MEPNTAPPPTSAPLAVGDRVDAFTITRAIREGGTGAVYEARLATPSPGTADRVAIKVLLGNWVEKAAALERFAREAKILERLKSPHTCRLLGLGNLGRAKGKLPYLVLELLDGADLADLRSARGKVPWVEAVRWIAEAAEAIAEAHAQGIVHRDLKPSNLFLTTTGADGDQASGDRAAATGADGGAAIKVLDFGVAKALAPDANPTGMLSSAVTQSGTIVGTLQYMSPEQLVHPAEVSPASDIWSLGAILHELVTGKIAFGGETSLAVCSAILMQPIPKIRAAAPSLPEPLEALLSRCLSRAIDDRPTASELASNLRALLG